MRLAPDGLEEHWILRGGIPSDNSIIVSASSGVFYFSSVCDFIWHLYSITGMGLSENRVPQEIDG